MSGVERVVVGYSGGKELNPTYQDIKDATECFLVEFDASMITFEKILDEWSAQHFPYYPQKAQYRSAIFYNSEEQRVAAIEKLESMKSKTEKQVYVDIEPVSAFYRAEEYHQDFLNKQRVASRGSCVF